VARELGIEDAEVERGVEGDDGDAVHEGLRELGRDRLEGGGGRLPVRAGMLGGDAVDGCRLVGDRHARVDEPRPHVGRGGVTPDERRGHDAVLAHVDARGLGVETEEGACGPCHVEIS